MATRVAAAVVVLGTALVARQAGAQGGRDDQMERPEVAKVTFRGVRAVDAGDLRKSIVTEPSRCTSLIFTPFCAVSKSKYFYKHAYLDRTEFRRDVLRVLVYYWQRGYRDAKVDTSVVGSADKVRVTFTVTEGPPTRIGVLSVADSSGVVTQRQMRRNVLLRAEQPLDLLKLDSSVVRLRRMLWERGYADAIVTPRVEADDSANVARVAIRLQPRWLTTVEAIRIEGTDRVDASTVRNSMTFRAGDLFRLSDVANSQRELYQSNLFRRAIIDTLAAGGASPCSRFASDSAAAARPAGARAAAAAGGPDSTKTVVVCLQEAPLREARVSGGFTTSDFGQLQGRFTHYYWLGGARRLDVQATVGNLLSRQLVGRGIFLNTFQIGEDADRARYFVPTWRASVDVLQRWFQSPRNSISGSLFSHRSSAPGIFIDRGFGASATFTRELGQRVPASATYRYELSTVEAGDVYFCVNFGVCDGGTIDALRRNTSLSPLVASVTLDRSDNPFSPRRGFVARFEAEHASSVTLSDFRYNRLYADFAHYQPVGRRAVLAGHLRTGWVNPLASTRQSLRLSTGEELPTEILHPRKRFYAGGSQSVRGYGENQLGPRVLTVPSGTLRGREISGNDTTWRCAPDVALGECLSLPGDSVRLRDREFTTRPLGGTTLLEGSVEFRFPVWRELFAAVFVDGAIVGERSLGDVASGTGAVTPGVGVRYRSPAGPIRVDVGINPRLFSDFSERLTVITDVDSAGVRRLVNLGPRVFPQEHRGGFRRILDNVVLHLSIGEAF